MWKKWIFSGGPVCFASVLGALKDHQQKAISRQLCGHEWQVWILMEEREEGEGWGLLIYYQWEVLRLLWRWLHGGWCLLCITRMLLALARPLLCCSLLPELVGHHIYLLFINYVCLRQIMNTQVSTSRAWMCIKVKLKFIKKYSRIHRVWRGVGVGGVGISSGCTALGGDDVDRDERNGKSSKCGKKAKQEMLRRKSEGKGAWGRRGRNKENKAAEGKYEFSQLTCR